MLSATLGYSGYHGTEAVGVIMWLNGGWPYWGVLTGPVLVFSGFVRPRITPH